MNITVVSIHPQRTRVELYDNLPSGAQALGGMPIGGTDPLTDPLLRPPAKTSMVAWRRKVLGVVLNVGVVALWSSEIELMGVIRNWCTDETVCPWKHPIFLGVALKMVFVLFLPVALIVRWRRERKLIDRRFFLLSGFLSLLLLGASITWVASIPLTLPAINSALYRARRLALAAVALPLPPRPAAALLASPASLTHWWLAPFRPSLCASPLRQSSTFP